MNERQRRRQASHERILDAAARLMCRDGLAGVGVMGVMAEAGLTHGGFYGHFASRDALLVATVEHVGARCLERLGQSIAASASDGQPPFRAFVDACLGDDESLETCVQCTAAIFAAGTHCAPGLREACTRHTLRLADFIESLFPPGRAPGTGLNVIGVLSGAVQVERMVSAARAAHIRQACRAMLLATYDDGTAGTAC